MYTSLKSDLAIEVTNDLNEKEESKEDNKEVVTSSVIHATANPTSLKSDSGKERKGISYTTILMMRFRSV